MKLVFSIQKIKANPTLTSKFQNLQQDIYIHRIYAQFIFIKPDGTSSFPLRGIIDTGAILSLFPMKFLAFYPDLPTEDHTLWGIVDTPECHIQAKLGVIPIKLVDRDENTSQSLSILAAFSSNANLPILLGMKDLLGKFSSSIDNINQQFTIEI